MRTLSRKRWLALAGGAVAILIGSLAGGCGGASGNGAEYAGTALDGLAPGFQLKDHNGVDFELADARGKVVVLAFMDSRCMDVCPLTAEELKRAGAVIGEAVAKVAFVGVNVNVDFNSVADVRDFNVLHGLDELAGWRFLTGEAADLRTVWESYSIAVQPLAGRDDYAHTPGIFVIDGDGRLRWYLSVPLGTESGAADWKGPALADLVVRRVREVLDARD